MQKIYIAAGALLLGTSALAYAADKEAAPLGESIVETSVQAKQAAKPIDAYAAAQSEASLAMAPSGVPMDKSASGEAVSAKLDTGDYADSSDAIVQSKLALASAKMDPAVPAETQAAVGGPLEEAEAATLAGLAPRPAAANYPPCEPGPGDDNCIQLYESGVRAQLASWNAPTGGLADGSATTAMGGPFEPVADHSDAAAASAIGLDAGMNGDGVIDPALGETEDVAVTATEADVSAHYQGVGGPVVTQSGYPPCEPGAGDDRCIQLYERGVTGAGN